MLAVERDCVHVSPRHASDTQHLGDREMRNPGLVLRTAQSLLLHGGDRPSIR